VARGIARMDDCRPGGATRLKVAVTDLTRSTVTVHGAVPVHAPLQPPKLDPAAAEAISLTDVPARYDSQQSPPHLIPAGVLVTVPRPAPRFATERVNDEAGSKNAITGAAPPTAVVHVARDPEQAPPQPVKLELCSGWAVSVTSVPAGNE
jgi:hypothetical protein